MKLTALAVVILALGVTLACSAKSGNSSASSTRCEDSATYLAAATITSHNYATAIADVFGLRLLRPGDEGEIAAPERDFVNAITDNLDDLGPPQELRAFHDALTAGGRDIARGLDLVSQGLTEEAGRVFLRLAVEDPIGDSMPGWVFECELLDDE